MRWVARALGCFWSVQQAKLERAHHASVIIQDEMYIFGGLTTTNSSKEEPTSVMIKYNINTGEYVVRQSNLPALSHHTMTAMEHNGQFYLYVFGGRLANGSASNKCYRFNLKSQQWNEEVVRGQIPSKRYGHTATVVDGTKIYFLGGTDGNKYFSDLYILDTETMTFTQLGVKGAPSPRTGHTVVSYGTTLYLFGGGNDDKTYNDLWSLDIDTLQWSKVATRGALVPIQRMYHTANVVANKMILFGGVGRLYNNNVMVLDLEQLSWSNADIDGSKTHIPPWLFGHTSVVYGTNLWVFGGKSVDEYSFNCMYMLETGIQGVEPIDIGLSTLSTDLFKMLDQRQTADLVLQLPQSLQKYYTHRAVVMVRCPTLHSEITKFEIEQERVQSQINKQNKAPTTTNKKSGPLIVDMQEMVNRVREKLTKKNSTSNLSISGSMASGSSSPMSSGTGFTISKKRASVSSFTSITTTLSRKSSSGFVTSDALMDLDDTDIDVITGQDGDGDGDDDEMMDDMWEETEEEEFELVVIEKYYQSKDHNKSKRSRASNSLKKSKRHSSSKLSNASDETPTLQQSPIFNQIAVLPQTLSALLEFIYTDNLSNFEEQFFNSTELFAISAQLVVLASLFSLERLAELCNAITVNARQNMAYPITTVHDGSSESRSHHRRTPSNSSLESYHDSVSMSLSLSALASSSYGGAVVTSVFETAEMVDDWDDGCSDDSMDVITPAVRAPTIFANMKRLYEQTLQDQHNYNLFLQQQRDESSNKITEFVPHDEDSCESTHTDCDSHSPLTQQQNSLSTATVSSAAPHHRLHHQQLHKSAVAAAAMQTSCYSDILFCVEQEHFFAHKCVLTSRSNYFNSMLCSGMEEARDPTVVIQDVRPAIFRLVLEYLYTDSVDIKFETSLELMIAAKMYDIERLTRMCQSVIERKIHVHNVCRILHIAESYDISHLYEVCVHFVVNHFVQVRKTAAFKELSSDIKSLLKDMRAQWAASPNNVAASNPAGKKNKKNNSKAKNNANDSRGKKKK